MGDGKSLASLNLSACLANASNPTLLVELDLRRPTIRKILESAVEPRLRSVVQGYFNYHAVPGNMAPGVEDALAGSVEPAETIQWIKETNLYTALVAKTPQNPFDLISGDGIGYFMRWARERFVWVVLDAPPVLPAADVPGLLPFVDAVLLVIRAHSTPRELSKSAIEILGKRLRGVIFNEVTVHSKPNFRYLADYR
jgi:Mrp family chromosome partitioning ATPase